MKILNRIALIAILSIIAINVLCPVLTFAKDVEKNTEDNNYYSNEIIDSKLCKSDADKQNIENRNYQMKRKKKLKLFQGNMIFQLKTFTKKMKMKKSKYKILKELKKNPDQMFIIMLKYLQSLI